MTGTILGHYEVLEQLGTGGMGEVYKARDTHLDRFVAIKVLRADAVVDPERTRRFVLEAKAASALNHPNIVTIHDIARADGIEYIVMEHVDGQTLDRVIGRGGMKLGDLLQYSIQAADALAKAHAAGIIHRDLKPSNIMVTADGRVKILDFGLAKLAAAQASSASDAVETTMHHDQARTGEGWVVGTPAYMSPEQAEGKPVDARSDIFSFGAVLYEMATGTSPFRGASAASTMAAVLTATPAPPSQSAPHLPKEVDRVISRCLRKEPSRRYQSMADLTLELEEIKAESGEWASGLPAGGPLTQRGPAANIGPATGRRWLWPVAAAVGAAVIVMVAVAWWRSNESTTPAAPPALTPLTTYQGTEMFPSLSPDGTHVAFVWGGERQDNLDIYVKPIDAVTPLRLTSDPLQDVVPSWSPSGREIAFVRLEPDGRGVIYVTPPIPGSERRIGEMRRTTVTGFLSAAGNSAVPSWTPDGKWLAVASMGPAEGQNGIFLIPVESGSRRTLVMGPTTAQSYGMAKLSADGRQLAYLACGFPPTPGCDIWVQSLAADFSRQGEPRRLTDFRAIVAGLTWAADGRSLVAAISTTQGAFSHLWRVPISDGMPQRLDWAGSNVAYPSVSHVGRRLVFTRLLGDFDISRFDAASTGGNLAKHPISSTMADVDPAFSPDGSKIAFGSARSGQEQEIWVAATDGSGPMQLTRRASGRNRGSPRWSHDGKWIAFDSSSEDGVRRAYVMDAAGGEARTLDEGQANFPTWSNDDRWIYFGSNRSGRQEIWRVPSDGGTAEQVTTEGGTAPRLSSDERTLYYRRATQILARPLAGGAERPVAEQVFGLSSAYLPLGNELFYVALPISSRPGQLELRATDVTTSRTRTVSRFEATLVSGLAVSPDGKIVLLSVLQAGADLMLVENFE